MPICEMCGREGQLVRTEVEGTEMDVCGSCKAHGKVLGKPRSEMRKVVVVKKSVVREEIEEQIVSDYGEKIRRAREKKKMKQEEFAQFLNEKESVLQKWEGGSLTPRIETARRLEKILGLKLVEKVERKKVDFQNSGSGEMTLGDMIKIKKRK